MEEKESNPEVVPPESMSYTLKKMFFILMHKDILHQDLSGMLKLLKSFLFTFVSTLFWGISYGPRREKTCLRRFRQS